MGCTWSSSAAPARARARSSPSGWPASWPGPVGLPVPDLVAHRGRPAPGRRRARRGDPGPRARQRRPEPRPRLPARRAAVQPGRPAGRGSGRGRRHRLARRAGDQPGSDGGQPEPARLARPDLAHRPRRRAVRPPYLARPGRARAPAVRARCATTSCCRTPRRSTAADARLAPRLDATRIAGRRGGHPGRLAARRPGHRRRGGPARRVPSLPRRAGCARPARSSRRPSVPDAPRSAYQYAIVRVVPRVDRGESLNVGVILLCREQRFLGARTRLDEARLARVRPRPATRRPSSPTSMRSRRSPAATRPAAPIARLGHRRAVPLAGGPGEHDHPAVGGPHRPHRRSRRPSWPTWSTRSSADARRRV